MTRMHGHEAIRHAPATLRIMRLSDLAFAILASLISAASFNNEAEASFSVEYMSDLPVEVREEIFGYLSTDDLTSLTKVLKVHHQDIVPTDYVKVKAILTKAHSYGKLKLCKLPLPSSLEEFSSREQMKNNMHNELTMAIKNLLIEHAPSKEAVASSFDYLLSTLSLAMDDEASLGVVAAIAASLEISQILLNLPSDSYAKYMPLMLEMVVAKRLDSSIHHAITNQLILDNLLFFSRNSYFVGRLDKFVKDILKNDDELTCEALVSQGEVANFILYTLETKMRNGCANKAALVILSHSLRRSHQDGKNVAKVLALIGSQRPTLFVDLFKKNEDILPANAARDVLLIAIEESYASLVQIGFNDFGITVDHQIVLLAWKQFVKNSSKSYYDQMGPTRFTFSELTSSSCISNFILDRAVFDGVDFSADDNVLLAEVISYNYTPLIKFLIRIPEVVKVGLTDKLVSSIRFGALVMDYETAELIVNAFGVGFEEGSRYFWNTNRSYLAYNRIPKMLAALGLPVDSEEVHKQSPSEETNENSSCEKDYQSDSDYYSD